MIWNRTRNIKRSNLAVFTNLFIQLVIFIYRVTHEEWGRKDDLKFFKYDDSNVKLSLFFLEESLLLFFLMISQKNKFTDAENHKG